jgi:fucose 4-O-acetylase-like acetyltransferase
MLKLTPGISKRIDILRLPMAIAVVWIHAAGLEFHFKGGQNIVAGIPESDAVVIRWISEVLARIAVPIFFVISGFLLFSANGVNCSAYLEKLRKRIRSLVTPFLLWNSLMVGVYLAGQWIPMAQPYFRQPLIESSNLSVEPLLNSVLGYRSPPLDVPLWFVRDLILLVILSPVLRLAVNLAPVPCFTLLLLRFFGFFPSPIPVLGPESTFCFSLGLWFGKNGIPEDPGARVRWSFLALWLAGTVAEAVTMPSGLTRTFVHNLNLGIGMTAVWWLTADLSRSGALADWLVRRARDSFFLFAAHGLVINVLRKLAVSILPMSHSHFTFVVIYGFVPVATLLICLGVYDALKRFAPGMAAVLGGQSREEPKVLCLIEGGKPPSTPVGVPVRWPVQGALVGLRQSSGVLAPAADGFAKQSFSKN